MINLYCPFRLNQYSLFTLWRGKYNSWLSQQWTMLIFTFLYNDFFCLFFVFYISLSSIWLSPSQSKIVPWNWKSAFKKIKHIRYKINFRFFWETFSLGLFPFSCSDLDFAPSICSTAVIWKHPTLSWKPPWLSLKSDRRSLVYSVIWVEHIPLSFPRKGAREILVLL